ncbi:MAG: hypothetical protein II998_02710 [Clostridia bacterium]|nr:hypothetical protein [Clostridia bacterium]
METLRDYVNWNITHCGHTSKAEGAPLVLEKCLKNRKMKQLNIYGESVQSGTPSPEAPVEIKSVGELVTDKSNANFGKYKIPLTINGTHYTNIYIREPLRKIGAYSDYIDFKNKKVVRNIFERAFNGTETWTKLLVNSNLWGFMVYLTASQKMATINAYNCTLCNTYPVSSTRKNLSVAGSTTSQNRFEFFNTTYADPDQWNAYVKSLSEMGTPLKVLYALATPYEEEIECELPRLEEKNVVLNTNTSVKPSNMKGEYIKK